MPCFFLFLWFPKPGEEFTLFPVSFYYIHWAFGWGMEDGGAPKPWQLVSLCMLPQVVFPFSASYGTSAFVTVGI